MASWSGRFVADSLTAGADFSSRGPRVGDESIKPDLYQQGFHIDLVNLSDISTPASDYLANLGRALPRTGGPYAYAKRAFGDFAGFMTGWHYWTCNLPYFPGLFYFTAASALFIGGAVWGAVWKRC